MNVSFGSFEKGTKNNIKPAISNAPYVMETPINIFSISFIRFVFPQEIDKNILPPRKKSIVFVHLCLYIKEKLFLLSDGQFI